MSASELTISKCSSDVSTEHASLALSDVVGADGPAEVSGEIDTETRRIDSLDLVCPRCERKFPCTEKSKWEIHCRRCTDD